MSQVAVVEPDGRSHDLALEMASADDVMREIISETLESKENGRILESGRTVCDGLDQIRGPMSRFPTSVKLASCPWGMAGAWHTHVTPDEVFNPQNSLPDISTVVFGHLDAVAVSGIETAEFFVSADDDAILQETFNDVIGFDAHSASDVVSAINDGYINPVEARTQLREVLPHLFINVDTGYDELRGWADDLYGGEIAVKPYEYVEAHQLYEHTTNSATDNIRYKTRRCAHNLSQMESNASFNIREMAVGAAIGTTVGNVVERVLF